MSKMKISLSAINRSFFAVSYYARVITRDIIARDHIIALSKIII